MVNKEEKGARILLVEDNEKILCGNKRMLEWEGYQVDTATTLAKAESCMHTNVPNLIILDVMLPDGSGLAFMKQLRASHYTNIPIMLLTGLSTPEDIICGLTQGGDDYLTKPYDFPVLLARVEALLRRSVRIPAFIEHAGLKLDITADVATLDGVDLLLSQKEFLILLILMQNIGRHVQGAYLYERIWKMPYTENNNALKSTMKRLRTKLVNSEYLIEWSRDEGYIFSCI